MGYQRYLSDRYNYLLTDDEKLLERINKYLTGQIEKIKPKCFYGEKDIRLRIRSSFEGMITSLEEAHITNARMISTYQLYSKIDYFEKKAQRLKQELGSNNK